MTGSPWLEGAVIRPSGEDAFVVEYGDTIDAATGHRVAALAAAFDGAAPPGLIEVVPTFRSLLVLFDPDRTGEDNLLRALPPPEAVAAAEGSSWSVPVCLTGEAAEDIDEAAEGLGMSSDALRQEFLNGTYQVGMYGFAPGFAYLSGVADALAIPRRKSPRPPMPEGSVILAGGMAALTSVPMPTGWYVIGRTAVDLFDVERDPMVPFRVGDTLRFRAVTPDELSTLGGNGGIELQ